MGEALYGQCLRNQDGKIDGCQEFSPIYGRITCNVCGCHRNYHRRVLKYTTEVVYTECHKMHVDKSGGGAYKDGCKEFVYNGLTGNCAACGCHKSFHRNEISRLETKE